LNTLAGLWFEQDVTPLLAAERSSGQMGVLRVRVAPSDETTLELRDFGFRARESGAAYAPQLEVLHALPTATSTATATATETTTSTATPSSTPTATATPTVTDTPTATPTVAPLPSPVAWLIQIERPSSGPLRIGGLRDSVLPSSTVRVTNLATGLSDLVEADALGRFTASLDGGVGDVLRVVTVGSGGAESPPAVRTVRAGTIGIDSPLAGSVAAASLVTVEGTYAAAGEVGVTVNGVRALTSNGMFLAPAVPVSSAGGAVTAVLTDQQGDRISDRIEVVGSDAPPPLTFTAENDTVFAPGLVRFGYDASAGGTIVSFAVDFDGDGIDDQSGVPPAPIQHTYSAAGLFRPRLRATDDLGVVYEAHGGVLVLASGAVDGRLRAIWTELGDALTAGDTDRALALLSIGGRHKYADVFSRLLPGMPGIVGSFSAPELSDLSADVGEYGVNRTIAGRDRLFLIYFVRGADGVWRIDAM
jgi:hypothetical protein